MCCCSEAEGADGQAVATPESWQPFPCIKPGEGAGTTPSLHGKQPRTGSVGQKAYSTDPVFIVDDLDQAAVLGLAGRWRYWPLGLMGLCCLLLQLLLQPTDKKKRKIQIKTYFRRQTSVCCSFSSQSSSVTGWKRNASRTINETISKILPSGQTCYCLVILFNYYFQLIKKGW